ncbi:MAG: hypothetical protein ACI8WA_001481 [Polaribacter sp.]|jgi:hypothetical protein
MFPINNSELNLYLRNSIDELIKTILELVNLYKNNNALLSRPLLKTKMYFSLKIKAQLREISKGKNKDFSISFHFTQNDNILTFQR